MNPQELVHFLKLLRDVGCLDEYWKNRINEVLIKIGAPIGDYNGKSTS